MGRFVQVNQFVKLSYPILLLICVNCKSIKRDVPGRGGNIYQDIIYAQSNDRDKNSYTPPNPRFDLARYDSDLSSISNCKTIEDLEDLYDKFKGSYCVDSVEFKELESFICARVDSIVLKKIKDRGDFVDFWCENFNCNKWDQSGLSTIINDSKIFFDKFTKIKFYDKLSLEIIYEKHSKMDNKLNIAVEEIVKCHQFVETIKKDISVWLKGMKDKGKFVASDYNKLIATMKNMENEKRKLTVFKKSFDRYLSNVNKAINQKVKIIMDGFKTLATGFVTKSANNLSKNEIYNLLYEIHECLTTINDIEKSTDLITDIGEIYDLLSKAEYNLRIRLGDTNKDLDNVIFGVEEAYKVLGVKIGVTRSELNKVYRKKALATHPDKGGNTAEFLKVQKAWELLTEIIK